MKKLKKKVKLKYKNIVIFLIMVAIIILGVYYFISRPITNIYIKGNNILSDNDIITIAKLNDYPISITVPSSLIKKRLINDKMIINAVVVKKKITKIYIDVKENRPLFFDSNLNKTVMLDKTTIQSNESTPYLLNYIPDNIYQKFIDQMINVSEDVLKRISEIEYKPNDVDKERFYLLMNDGNYVYLTLSSFDKINNYINMLKQFEGKKGTFYLDSGEYFELR